MATFCQWQNDDKLPEGSQVTEKEKRIVTRVSSTNWTAIDNKRHAARISFQALGERLWLQWLEEAATIPDKDSAKILIDIRDSAIYCGDTTVTVPQEVATWIPKLAIVLSGPARRALEANLNTFAEYTELKGGSNGPPPGNSADELQKNLDVLADKGKDIESRIGKHDRGHRKRDKAS